MPATDYYTGSPLRVGQEPQLLLDDGLVEDRIHLSRVLYHPAKYEHNPILLRDKPWEGDGVQAPLVVWDPERNRYRMWYTCIDMNSYYQGGYVFYLAHAESDDGVRWHKPLNDHFPIGQYLRTNVVYAGAYPDPRSRKWIFQPGQVFRDESDPDPRQRFKMIGLDGHPDPEHNGEVNTEPNLITSPDGIHWRLHGSQSILDHHSDCANLIMYDPTSHRWLLYCRPPLYSSGRDMEERRHHRRRVAVMISDDFTHWSYPRTVLYPDEGDLPDIDQITVFRRGSHFIMLYAAMDGEGNGRWHCRLASSRDGLHWERFHTREDFIPCGSEGSWDAAVIPCGAPVASGDKLLLYYSGYNMGQHETNCSRQEPRSGGGMAVMTRDRFVAQRAGTRTGYLLTREILLNGKHLKINAAPEDIPGHRGRVRVEICRHPPLGEHAKYFYHEQGYSYRYDGFGLDDCDGLTGNGLDAEITWQGRTLAALRGKPAYLRFELTHADLFSFSITDA